MKIVLLLALAVSFLPFPCFAGPPKIEVKVASGAWTGGPASPLVGERVRLRVAKESGAVIRWYQIIPDVTGIYHNAGFPWDPNAYKWIGLEKIRYDREELTNFRGQWEIEPFHEGSRAKKEDWTGPYKSTFAASGYYHPDVGSFWFQVEVEKDGNVRTSPGAKEADAKGLRPDVLRVSLREGPGYAGYVTSFFNVPALFGSIPDQSNHYLGADCADTLVSAFGQWKGKDISINYNVARLVTEQPKVAEFNVMGSMMTKIYRWGKDVFPGDWIAIRYTGSKTYQHIGMLAKDDGNGELDGPDLILHAGPYPLDYTPLGSGAFDGHVVILRPKTIKDR